MPLSASIAADETRGSKVDALFAEYTGANVPGASVAIVQ
jgi:hypothetical protein